MKYEKHDLQVGDRIQTTRGIEGTVLELRNTEFAIHRLDGRGHSGNANEYADTEHANKCWYLLYPDVVKVETANPVHRLELELLAL